MAVAKTVYDKYITLAGTLAEVVQQMSDDKVPRDSVLSIYYDAGTSKTTAIIWIG